MQLPRQIGASDCDVKSPEHSDDWCRHLLNGASAYMSYTQRHVYVYMAVFIGKQGWKCGQKTNKQRGSQGRPTSGPQVVDSRWPGWDSNRLTGNIWVTHETSSKFQLGQNSFCKSWTQNAWLLTTKLVAKYEPLKIILKRMFRNRKEIQWLFWGK